jgi:hypothetical protein
LEELKTVFTSSSSLYAAMFEYQQLLLQVLMKPVEDASSFQVVPLVFFALNDKQLDTDIPVTGTNVSLESIPFRTCSSDD